MLLLPGSVFVIAFIVGVLGTFACTLAALVVGAGVFQLSQVIIKRTQAYRRLQEGQMNADRWWFNFSAWAGTFAIGTFIVCVYAIVGPYINLFNYLWRQ